MSLYITLSNEFETEKWNISSYGKQGDIEISSWPSVDEQPANKSECYWSGSEVLLKSQIILDSDQAKVDLAETDEQIQERGIDDLIDVLTSTGTITLGDLPQALQDKYNARKALRENI